MQPQAAFPIHPTRSAPLCYDCKHFLIDIQADRGVCNHPGTPRDPITGNAVALVKHMRARFVDTRLGDLESAHCGLSAALFEPAASACKANDGQSVGDGNKPCLDTADLVAERVLQHDAQLLPGARLNESPHQLRVGGGVSLPEVLVD